jgi:site-specific DNA recombinase
MGAMGAPAKPVDIYVRISRIGTRENVISDREQERSARALATHKHLTVGEVIPDIDESGGRWERPGLQRALDRVRRGESGGLIVAWLDRLSRDSEHAHRLVREIHDAGGKIYAPDAPADWTTPEGELQAGIMFAFAQYVRQRARAGLERAKEQAIANGIPVATRPPVGYRQRGDRRLEPDPEIAPTIQTVFERRAAGAGPTELARLLEEQGVRTSQGSATWTKQAVMVMLSNRAYLGELAYGKDRRYVNTAAHEPIVDEAVWLAAQHPNGRVPQRSRSGEYLLTGILRCVGCGYSLNATRTSHGHRIYRCARRHSGGVCPEPARHRADPVEALVEAELWDLVENPTLAEVENDQQRELLVARVTVTERRYAQAMTPEFQDAAGDEWPAIVKQRRADRDAAVRALAEHDAARGRRRDLRSLREHWDDMTVAERREAISPAIPVVGLRRAPRALIFYTPDILPADLSRRGFRRNPGMRPLDVPPGARVLALEDSLDAAIKRGERLG